jgi:NACalpha-BTF3-like transcription factor
MTQNNEMASMNANLKASEGQEKQVDAKKFDEKTFAATMTDLQAQVRSRKDAEKAKEAALAAVAVSEDDVKLVAHHCDLSLAAAKRKLQQHNGDVAATFAEYVA